MLAVGVLLLVVIDIIILSTYTIVGLLKGSFHANLVVNKENPEDHRGVSAIRNIWKN